MPQLRSSVISLVVPVHNEGPNLAALYQAIQAVKPPAGYRLECIFVNDGSDDDSAVQLAAIEQAGQANQVLTLSRNFGKEIAVTAGIHAATGQAAIILDADLQHPIELIPDFIAAWQNGADVVVGVRQDYRSQPVWKRLTSAIFYGLLKRVSSFPVTPHATDFRLIDRQVIDAFKQLGERNRMTRGLIDWLGFERAYVYFTPQPRHAGTPTYSPRKLFGLALNSVVGLSLFPLRLAGYLGIIITLLAGAAGLFIIIENFGLNDPLHLNFSGPAMLAVLNMFWIGIVLSALGLVALYIANIHAEVLGRPLYVLRQPRRQSKK